MSQQKATPPAQCSPRRSSAASQARRASIASRRGSVGVPRGSQSGSRRSSRRGSGPNLDANQPFGFDFPGVGLSDPALYGGLDNFDFGAGWSIDASGYNQPQDYGYQHNQIDPNLLFLDNVPAPVRNASINALQNPLSALPGAANDLGNFGYGYGYVDAFDSYAPRAVGQEFVSPQNDALAQARSRALILQRSNIQTLGETSPPVLQKSTIKTIAAMGSENDRSSVMKANDEFTGYMPSNQGYDYQDPDSLFVEQSEPYYGDASYQQQDSYVFREAESVIAKSPTKSATPSRSTRSSRSGRSSNGHSDSTYPDRSRRSSSSGESDSSFKQRKRRQGKRKSVFDEPFKYETPKFDPKRGWIRINATTKGETTRTAKCNNFDPAKVYTYAPHPLGDWSSGRYEFKYTPDGEFQDKTMSANQIRDFILRYPEDKKHGIMLKLWIQVGPTDSARRYNSPFWNKCRFQDCPANLHQTGTIVHGHYRVAFDERSFGTKDDYDPHMAAAGYVHLYCMERFLDFEYICRKAHVEVDTRQLSKEPKARFAATLAGQPECSLAEDFVEFARRGRVRELPEFVNYPRHDQYKGGKSKPHEDTLVYHMTKIKNNARPPAQIRQFIERTLKPTHLVVNMGDLEVLFEENIRKKKAARKKTKKRKRVVVEDEEKNEGDEDPYLAKKQRLLADAEKVTKAAKHKAAPKRGRPRRQSPEEWDHSDSDSESEDERPIKRSRLGSGSSGPIRRSARLSDRHQPNYTDQLEQPAPTRKTHAASIVPAGYRKAADCPTEDATYAPPARDDAATSADQFDDDVLYADLAATAAANAGPAQLHAPTPTGQTINSRKASISSIRPFYDAGAVQDFDLDAYFEGQGLGLDRRQSSIRNSISSILRARRSTNSSLATVGRRHASFNEQPVSQSQTFDTEAPPQDVEAHGQEIAQAIQAAKAKGRKGKAKEANPLGVKGDSHKIVKKSRG